MAPLSLLFLLRVCIIYLECVSIHSIWPPKWLSDKESADTWVRSLGWEDPLEEGMATQSCILALRIPWTEEPGGLQSMGLQKVRHD